MLRMVSQVVFSTSLLSAVLLLGGPGAEPNLGAEPNQGTRSIQAGEVPGAPQLDVGYELVSGFASIEAQLRGGPGQGSLFLCSLGDNAFDPRQAFALGYGVLDQRGFETFSLPIGALGLLPSGLEVHFGAISIDASTGKTGAIEYSNAETLLIQPHARFELDYDYSVGGVRNHLGEVIDEQYADLGIHVSASNPSESAPGLAVLMESSMATGTGGVGTKRSIRHNGSVGGANGSVGDASGDLSQLGMRLVVSANEADVAPQDGLIDDPASSPAGGFLQFDFDLPFDVYELAVADIPLGETVAFKGYDAAGRQVDHLVVRGFGGHQARTIGVTMLAVSRLRVVFSSTGSLVHSSFGGGSCTQVIDFDTTVTGVPLGLPSGTILTTQLEGVTVAVSNNNANHPDAGLLFDTASRTGGDTDLMTPGGGIDNTEAQNLVLIIAEDAVDADGDGLVDNPDDERTGGVISLAFDEDITFVAASVLDIDTDETASFEAFSAAGASMGVFPLASLGDNSFQRLEANLDGVRRIELQLSGSGALASLEFCDGQPIVADFDGTPKSGTAPLVVNFSDLSTGGPSAWSWDFGDGMSSSVQNPTHIYGSSGTYTVSLTASGAMGSDTETKQAYIVVAPPAINADFAGTPLSGTAPLSVAFTDLSTGNPNAWSWDFGDGSTSTSQNPSHVFIASGSYTVALTATGAGGSDTETKLNYIVVGAPPIAADFVGSPLIGNAPLQVVFRDLSTGGPTSWQWSFGDGGSATLQNVNHIYTTPGTYTVSLTATGLGGSDTETKQGYITVTAPPPVNADFQADITSGTSTLRVDFTDLSTGNPTSWSWDFGDGTFSNVQNPQNHDYVNDGCYTVTLTASGAGGSDTEVKSMYIQVGVDFNAVYPEFQVLAGGSSCVNCHNTASPAGGLDLIGPTGQASEVYRFLVNVPAQSSASTVNCGQDDRVEPCDLNNSVLYQSVIASGCRSQMFNISPNLESLLKSWIEGGAR